MRSSHPLVCAVLMVLVMCAGVHAGIYYEQEMKMPAQPGMPTVVSKQVVYISGLKMRIEGTTMGTKVIAIQRHDKGMTYQLMPDRKVCMEMPIPKPPAQPAGQEPTVTVTKTEETARIGKWNCSRYDVTVDGQLFKYWMTEDVDLGSEIANYWRTTTRNEGDKIKGQEMSKVKGFPVRMEMPSPQGTIVLTVTTVKKQDIPDSMFEVPADYRKMSMPMPMSP